MEWIKIDKSGSMPKDSLFFLSDEFGHVYVGRTSFDYYDAEYWFPFPKYPMSPTIIKNDGWLYLSQRTEK